MGEPVAPQTVTQETRFPHRHHRTAAVQALVQQTPLMISRNTNSETQNVQ